MSNCIDLSKWMTNLPEELKRIPLMYLAIPGTHESMAFDLDNEVSLESKTVRCLKRCVKEKLMYMIPWMKSQYCNTTEQLEHGIRYFDLRVSSFNGQMFFSRGFFTRTNVQTELENIKTYLEENEFEIVILDFRNFHFRDQYRSINHKSLIQIITDVFGPMLCPPMEDMKKLTLNNIYNQKQNVIVIYGDDKYAKRGNFWHKDDFPTICGDKAKARHLLDFVRYFERPEDKCFVTQVALIPDDRVIFRKLTTSNLMWFSGQPVFDSVLPWLYDRTPMPPPTDQPAKTVTEAGEGEEEEGEQEDEKVRINIVTTDYFDYKDFEFPKKIIELNNKMLPLLPPPPPPPKLAKKVLKK